MPIREYYTVDRSPREVRELWDWATEECRGRLEHETPYAMGVLACMEYLMGETEARPQDYHGVFSLKNVLKQSPQEPGKVGSMGNACFNKASDCGPDAFLPGNPKTFFYDAPLFGGNAPGGKR